jgi:hypothetical protein
MYNFYIKNATSISINNHLNYEFLNLNHGHLLSLTIEYVPMVIRPNPLCFGFSSNLKNGGGTGYVMGTLIPTRLN